MEDQAPSAPAEGWTLCARLRAMIERRLAPIVNADCRERSAAMASLAIHKHGHPAIILSPHGPRWHPMDRRALAEHHPDIVPTQNTAQTSIRKLVQHGILEIDPASVQPTRRNADGTITTPPLMYRFAAAFAAELIAYTEEVLLRGVKSSVETISSSKNNIKNKKEVSTDESRKCCGEKAGSAADQRKSLDAIIRERALARSEKLYHPSASRPHETHASTLARLRGEMMHRVYVARDAARKALDRMSTPQVVSEPMPVVPYTGRPIPLDALETIPDRTSGDDECFGRLASKVFRRCMR